MSIVQQSRESEILHTLKSLESSYGEKIKKFTQADEAMVKELSKSVDVDTSVLSS